MKYNSFFRAILLFVALFVSLLLSSCNSDDGTNYLFRTVIDSNPQTLDPQTCINDNSYQVIMNVFQGLYRFTDGGNVVPAMAKSCKVSDDGLVWDFTINEDVRWYDGREFSAECTADDFVFAFRRLMNPALKAKNAVDYYCIENAEAINKGEINDIYQLGITSTGKYSLRIKLREPRSDFMALLAMPPSMPCNEEFYIKTEGQYGLNAESIASNGYFYVNSWTYDKWSSEGNIISLRKNKKNAENTVISPYGINIYIGADNVELFRSGSVHSAAVTDNTLVSEFNGRYNSKTYENSVLGLVFNCDGVFSSLDMRIALGGAARADFNSYVYTAADCIIPCNSDIGGKNYRKISGKPEVNKYGLSELSERYERATAKLKEGSLSGMKLIMPNNEELKEAISGILQEWQKDYGFYCNISVMSDSDYSAALSNGDFDIALVRLNGGGDGAVSYISRFSESSSLNYGNAGNLKLENIIKSIVNSADTSKTALYCLEAEQIIIENYFFVPLCFEKEYVFFAKGVEGIEYDPCNSVFIYKNAVKK